jgi:hypothetical protein
MFIAPWNASGYNTFLKKLLKKWKQTYTGDLFLTCEAPLDP